MSFILYFCGLGGPENSMICMGSDSLSGAFGIMVTGLTPRSFVHRLDIPSTGNVRGRKGEEDGAQRACWPLHR